MKALSPSPGLLWELFVGLREHSLMDYGVIELIELVVLMRCGCTEWTCLDGLTPYLSEIEKERNKRLANETTEIGRTREGLAFATVTRQVEPESRWSRGRASICTAKQQ